MDIEFSKGKIGDEPRIKPLVTSYAREMARKGLINEWKNDDDYHYATLFCNDEPMTAILFAPIPSHRIIYCSGAYTRPSWRRCGLYTDLWNLCVNIWRQENLYDWFLSGYSKGNWVSREMQKAQGREEYEDHARAVRTRFSLKPTGNEVDLVPDDLLPILQKIERLTL